MLEVERFNVDKLVDTQVEAGSSKLMLILLKKKGNKQDHQSTRSSMLVPHTFQNALEWTVTEKALDGDQNADKLVDSMAHGPSLMMSKSVLLTDFKILPNFQPAINGSPPTANQFAPEISPPDALRRELQNLQEETDSRENGLTSQARPPSSQEFSQKTVLLTTTSTERQNWELSN